MHGLELNKRNNPFQGWHHVETFAILGSWQLALVNAWQVGGWETQTSCKLWMNLFCFTQRYGMRLIRWFALTTLVAAQSWPYTPFQFHFVQSQHFQLWNFSEDFWQILPRKNGSFFWHFGSKPSCHFLATMEAQLMRFCKLLFATDI